jgi:hypothetical protein
MVHITLILLCLGGVHAYTTYTQQHGFIHREDYNEIKDIIT